MSPRAKPRTDTRPRCPICHRLVTDNDPMSLYLYCKFHGPVVPRKRSPPGWTPGWTPEQMQRASWEQLRHRIRELESKCARAEARLADLEKRPTVRVIEDAKQWGYDGPVVEASTPTRSAVFGMDATALALANWLGRTRAPKAE